MCLSSAVGGTSGIHGRGCVLPHVPCSHGRWYRGARFSAGGALLPREGGGALGVAAGWVDAGAYDRHGGGDRVSRSGGRGVSFLGWAPVWAGCGPAHCLGMIPGRGGPSYMASTSSSIVGERWG